MRIQDITPDLLQFAESAAPATPASGVVRIYAKTDGKLYIKDDTGTESPLVGVTVDAVMTTEGDTLYQGASAPARLAIGTARQHLRVNAGATAPEWVTETRALSFYVDGTLAVETNTISIIAPMALTITEIRVAVDTAPTGANLIIDVNKNGTTMYTTQANRPTITAGNTSATATDPDVTAIALGDKITIDIDQVGSTVAGENLSVIIICEVA